MRSVIRRSTPRCPLCLLPPRWCICAAQRAIACPLQIDLLTHQRELTRPSSTGNLIKRLLPATQQHGWRADVPVAEGAVVAPGKELWILHPNGEPVPASGDLASTQVLLLDGNWSEASAMANQIGGWGRLVSLPMQGESRFWLRTQQDGGRFSTVEALMFLLDAVGLSAVSAELRIQFELHVYAGLRSRGRTDLAAEFLAGSVIQTALTDYLAQLHTRRPLAGLAAPLR